MRKVVEMLSFILVLACVSIPYVLDTYFNAPMNTENEEECYDGR